MQLEHGIHPTQHGLRFTFSPNARGEVLDRLLELNHLRYAEEVAAGLHEKGVKRSKAAEPVQQTGLRGKAVQPSLDLGFELT